MDEIKNMLLLYVKDKYTAVKHSTIKIQTLCALFSVLNLQMNRYKTKIQMVINQSIQSSIINYLPRGCTS